MKYYCEQRLFSFKDKFDIYDQDGQVAYYVESELFTIGKKFHIYDCYDQPVGYIEQQAFRFLPHFDITVENRFIGTLVKDFSLFSHHYYLENSDLTVEGDFMSHDYQINCQEGLVATINKEWFSFGDKYCITVQEQYQPLVAIAVMLAIDAVMANASAHANNTNH